MAEEVLLLGGVSSFTCVALFLSSTLLKKKKLNKTLNFS
jgi:hypothetical protein